MAKHGRVEEFIETKETWDAYVERLELYFQVNDIDQAEKKRAVLLTVCGPATYKLVRNLVAPKKPAEVSYADLVALVKEHITPAPSVIVQQFKFHTRVQQAGEPVAAFVAGLRQLTEHCAFGGSLDDMLRDRLVCGIANKDIQRRLLAESGLTLQKAIDLARAMETADKDVKDLQGSRAQPAMTEVHAVTQKRGGQPQSVETPCCRCGGKHSPRACQFKTSVCHTCKRRGHIARMCHSGQGRHAGQKSQGAQARPGERRQTYSVEGGQAHAVEGEGEQPQLQAVSSDPESYTLYPVQSQRVHPIEVQAKVNGACMTMELDTGASLTIISEQTYRKTWPQDTPPLQPSSTKLCTYTGEELEVRGSLPVAVEYKDQRESLQLLVVAGNGPSLLGRNWLQKLHLDWREIC